MMDDGRRVGPGLAYFIVYLSPYLLQGMWILGLGRIFLIIAWGHRLLHDHSHCFVSSLLYSSYSNQNVPGYVPTSTFSKPVSPLWARPRYSLTGLLLSGFSFPLPLGQCSTLVTVATSTNLLKWTKSQKNASMSIWIPKIGFYFFVNKVQFMEEHENHKETMQMCIIISHTWIMLLVKFKGDCSSESYIHLKS